MSRAFVRELEAARADLASLAQALLARAAGERLTFQGGEAEIISIEP